MSVRLRRVDVTRAIRVSLLVGTILAVINHGDVLLGGTLDTAALSKILLTYFVPFGVSLYSSVRALAQQGEETQRPS